MVYVVHCWPKCHYGVHGCIVLHILIAPLVIIRFMYIYLIFHNHCTYHEANYVCPLNHLFPKFIKLLICGRHLSRFWVFSLSTCLLSHFFQTHCFSFHLYIDNAQVFISKPDLFEHQNYFSTDFLFDISFQMSQRHFRLNLSEIGLVILPLPTYSSSVLYVETIT